jgi:hypothetical protein
VGVSVGVSVEVAVGVWVGVGVSRLYHTTRRGRLPEASLDRILQFPRSCPVVGPRTCTPRLLEGSARQARTQSVTSHVTYPPRKAAVAPTCPVRGCVFHVTSFSPHGSAIS